MINVNSDTSFQKNLHLTKHGEFFHSDILPCANDTPMLRDFNNELFSKLFICNYIKSLIIQKLFGNYLSDIG